MRRDLACSLILIVVAVCYYVAADRIGETALSDAVGPAGLARIYAVALAVVAAAIGIAALLGNRRGTAAERHPGASNLAATGAARAGNPAAGTGPTATVAPDHAPQDRETPGDEAPGPARRLARGAGTAAIGVAGIVAAPLIGYPFAIALMIAAMAVYQGERPTLRALIVAAAGAAALFVLFDVVLGVTLPAPWNG